MATQLERTPEKLELIIVVLKAENKRLRKERERAIDDCKLLKATREENERLRLQVENYRLPGREDIAKDAERYRWLMADLLRAIDILRKGLRRRNTSELIDAAMGGGE